MTVSPLTQACRKCGWLGLPKRLWCPNCGGDDWMPVTQARGTVAAITRIRRSMTPVMDPRPIVLVGLSEGWLIAAADDDVVIGDLVTLARRGNSIVATPSW